MKMDTPVNYEKSGNKRQARAFVSPVLQATASSPQHRHTPSLLRKVKRNDGADKDEKKLTTVHRVRTPLAIKSQISKTPSPLSSKTPEKFPLKRRFSKEDVLDLSRSQMATAKESKAANCLRPPKRIRLDDFHYRRTDVRYTSCTTKTFHGDQKKPELKLVKPLDMKLPNMQKSKINDCKGAICPRSSPGVEFVRKERSVSHFLVSVEGFPIEEWQRNNRDIKMLNRYIESPSCKVNAVKLETKDGQLLVNMLNPKVSRPEARQHSPEFGVTGVVFAISTLPLVITVKIFTGVMKWILGR